MAMRFYRATLLIFLAAGSSPSQAQSVMPVASKRLRFVIA